MKDNWVVFFVVVLGPIYLSYSMEIIKTIIVQKVNSLKKYKKFMNISEQGIIILKERQVQYANAQFLNIFKNQIQ